MSLTTTDSDFSKSLTAIDSDFLNELADSYSPKSETADRLKAIANRLAPIVPCTNEWRDDVRWLVGLGRSVEEAIKEADMLAQALVERGGPR